MMFIKLVYIIFYVNQDTSIPGVLFMCWDTQNIFTSTVPGIIQVKQCSKISSVILLLNVVPSQEMSNLRLSAELLGHNYRNKYSWWLMWFKPQKDFQISWDFGIISSTNLYVMLMRRKEEWLPNLTLPPSLSYLCFSLVSPSVLLPADMQQEKSAL